MVTARRGEIFWVDLGVPKGSEPAFRRHVVIVSADAFNRSHLATAVVAAITSNLDLARMPGNVLLAAGDSGLSKDSVVNVTQLATIDRGVLDECVGSLTPHLVNEVDAGLRLSLAL